MNARRTLLSLICLVASVLALSSCFGSVSSGPPLPIAVSFSTAPPNSINVGGNVPVAATVFNDGSNAGVNWACMPSAACGSFTLTHTASDVQTTYMAPATVPAGGSVTVMATSAADGTKFALGNVTINPGGAISVSFNSPAPPPSLTISAVATVSATVNSLLASAVNQGVTWSVTCSGATSGCGTFPNASSTIQVLSGISTTYTAPPSTPAGGLAVTITAASTFDPLVSVSTVITVSSATPAAFLCAGCAYTYTVSGEDVNGPFAVAGVFIADGMGGITGGEQDFGDLTFSTENAPDSILSGNYSFGSDGRGTINLTTANLGAETLGVVFVSANHLLITELDQSATASGVMDMQTVRSFSPSTLSGAYVFVSSGASIPTLNFPSPQPLGFGGVFNVPAGAPGTISSSGSTCDANFGGFVSTQQALTGSYPVPDAFGRVQITLHANFIGNLNLGLSGPIVLATYINDATHLKFVEVDPNFGVTSGLAVGQGGKTGTFTTGGVLPANSSYVFTAFGAGVTGPQAFATTFTSDGISKLQNGSSDVNAAGVPSSGSLSGTYSVDSSGTGRVGVTLNGNVGNPGNSAAYAVYLTGGSDPALVLELDSNAITSGFAYTQASGAFSLSSFDGPYGLNFTLFDPMGSAEFDVSGQMLADGQGNLLGTLDINANGTPDPNKAATGSYASSASGRFTGSITSTPTGTLQVSYFVVSASQVVFIETDTGVAVSLGLFQLQTPPF